MFGWKRKNQKTLPALRSLSFLESAWITNFWMFDDLIYFTDADLVHPVSTLNTLPFEELKTFLLNQKSDFQSDFFQHPHQLISSPLKANKSGLTFYRLFNGYLYNMNFIKNQLLISLIQEGDKGGVFYNARLIYQDIVLLGFLNHHLMGKNIVDKRTLQIQDAHNYQVFPEDIKKICRVGEHEVYLNNKRQVIFKKQIIFESLDEINIAAYSPSKLLVSEKRTQTLFLLSGSRFHIRQDIWKGNYFYQLYVFNEQIIAGKPLYDQQKYINYNLPVIFIY
ncbi:hypothetical protein JN01_0313 [Entomoplasma freundtii]|uniref:Uncharacterized protein n=1 Tax=Entomoplasma freundtii TaxID=74700 RepID=A0A2K8NR63_9MOLU|nr:hypothetical protein [Entomoplasma freundtii]ATZ16274.1 hypothetical protein EFREU_v1c02470 [Entomoplasma freundtii]TDY56825.1 hypothetical protein JN01_0313 [Entomoplasma freundtii]